MTTETKERGRIVSSGMGGFLNPPTHPEHTHSVETDLRRRPEDRGRMSLSYAATCEYLADETRAAAKRRLDEWVAPPVDSPEIQAWIRRVLGYFAGCYKGPDGEGCWDAGKLRIDSKADPMLNIDLHAGVRLIREYYPDFTPAAQHFAEARWGK